MSTKLEAMVGLLAGREAEPGLLDELADPSSEASRFLEATRARSKALFVGPEGPGVIRSRRGRRVALATSTVAALAVLAAVPWLVDRRFRRLEATLDARDLEARADSRRLEAILQGLAEPRPAPEPLAPLNDALGRIEADLNRLEGRDREPASGKGDVGITQVREELASIRRELATAERVGEQRLEEVRASVHDAARVLRLLLKQLDPTGPVPEPPPGFNAPRPPANVESRRVKP